MTQPDTLYVTSREEWRAWLAENHATAKEIWLIFYKKNSGQPSLPYDQAVEEALCFGWIDSLLKRIDEKSHRQKFSPRSLKSNWSNLNKQRVAQLIADGRMTEAGLAKVTYPNPEAPELEEAPRPEKNIPAPILQALMASPQAWENFNRLAPSHRRRYIGWITSAKREETQLKRAQEAVGLLLENKKLENK